MKSVCLTVVRDEVLALGISKDNIQRFEDNLTQADYPSSEG